jgi:protein SCO1/2
MMKSVWAVLLIFTIAVIAATYLLSDVKRQLPVINPKDVNPDLVDESLHNKGVDHQILPFNLQNQEGEWITEKSVAGKILVVDYFFTTCPSICPMMTGELMKVNEHFKTTQKVMILSHTVWPEVDSVSVMKEYAGRYNADVSTWQFLTGSKSHLYALARKSYLIVPDAHDANYSHGSENDFIHTENVALIDTKGRIRGFYDGTDALDIQRLIEDIELLISYGGF